MTTREPAFRHNKPVSSDEFAALASELKNLGWLPVLPAEPDRYFNAPGGRASIRIRGYDPTPRVFLTARSTTGKPRWGIDWTPALPVALQIHLVHAASPGTGATHDGAIADEQALPDRQRTTRQTATPLTQLRTTTGLWSIDEYTRRIRRGEMLLDPPYQRASVWNTQQRMDLMRSWLQGVPIPAVVLNERTIPAWHTSEPAAQVTYAVVDGRQRLETALAWQDGQLAVPASWLPADWIHTTEDTDDGAYVRSTGLVKPRQVTRVMDLSCVRAAVDTVAAEAAIYLLVNGAGTAQSTHDLQRAAGIAAT